MGAFFVPNSVSFSHRPELAAATTEASQKVFISTFIGIISSSGLEHVIA